MIGIADGYAQHKRPHVSEWFGHRVFPMVASSEAATGDQKQCRCPFLTRALASPQSCVKAPNSQGVCTISAVSNGPRQDWLVCPIRALDNELIDGMVRRLYGIGLDEQPLIVPVRALEDSKQRAEVLQTVAGATGIRVFLYFQDKLGGEIGLSRTQASPEVSFDTTIVELLPGNTNAQATLVESVTLGKYGVIEMQTTDTHGSYKQAVAALRNGLDLHPNDFPAQLAANPVWAGRAVEGPNISNVFKRTFYQIAFKFQAMKDRETSVGCVLALPKPVWDSWQPFLGAPELHQLGDGTWRLLDDQAAEPSDWIYVFDVAEKSNVPGQPAPIHVKLVIGTDAATLSRAALDIAPAKAIGHSGVEDAIVTTLRRRLRSYLPDIV
jgi:hypothetical protein